MVVTCSGPPRRRWVRDDAMNPVSQERRPTPKAISGPVRAANRLGFEVFARLARQEPSSNLCLSPSSLAFTLGMSLSSARGPTHTALAKALGLHPGVGHDRMASWRRTLLEHDPAVQLTLASSIWSDVGITLRPDVLADLRLSYDALATSLDFRLPSATRTINEWVQRATEGAIADVVSYLDPQARLILVGALHFRGRWTRAFQREWTRDETFHLPDGGEFPLPMMKASDEFQHFKTDEMEGLALPYGGGRWRMLVFLPAKEASWSEVVAGLNVDAWERWSRRLRKDQGTIVLPRFRLESSLTLAGVLNDLGLPMAVDVQLADFGGATIDTAPLTVGALLQRIFVEVDEVGTEAAAATLMVQVVAWPPPSWQPFHMQVDRPFLFGIEDTYSDSMLFVGAVYDPRPGAGSRPAGASFIHSTPRDTA